MFIFRKEDLTRYKEYLKRFQKIDTIKCDVCHKILKRFSFKQHFISHTSDTNHRISRHTCSVCGKGYSSQSYLSIHLKTHETGYGTKYDFKCTACDKVFYSSENLRAHFSRTHIHGQGHICDYCGKKVTSKSSLREHLNLHKGIKPQKCSYCEKTFTLKRTLKVHERTHTGEKPYKCRECGKGFAQIAPLRIHTRYHTNERPYECTLCKTGYVSRSALKVHQQTKHSAIPL